MSSSIPSLWTHHARNAAGTMTVKSTLGVWIALFGICLSSVLGATYKIAVILPSTTQSKPM
jgi:uncharacterized membrane protein SpoIIM required for sporulation